MKSVKYLILAALFLVPVTGQAQYRRDRDWNAQGRNLDQIADNLTDRAQHVWGMVRGGGENRDEQDGYLRRALRDFARNTRNWAARLNNSTPDTYRTGAEQLVREAENISRLVDRTEMTYHLRDDWNAVEDEVYRLSQFYGIGFSPDTRMSRYYRGNRQYQRDRELARTDPYYNDPYYRDQYGREGYDHGTLRWRGSVDGSDIINLRGRIVDIQHLQANPVMNESYDLPSALPRADVNVQLRKLRGRGNIQLIQQPSARNNYTAAVRIDDPDGGRDYYEFELTW